MKSRLSHWRCPALYPRQARKSIALILLPGSLAFSLFCHLQEENHGIASCELSKGEDPIEAGSIRRLSGNAVSSLQNGIVLGRDKQTSLGSVEIWTDVRWTDRKGRDMGNEYVQLAYNGMYAKDANWILFIMRKKWDKKGNLVDENENIRVDKSLWHRRGEWYLDSPRFARTPFYSVWGMHTRSTTELSIFDKPLGDLNPPIHSKLIIELDSYLVLQNRIVWRIRWQVTETLKHGREVKILSSCPANAILEELKQMIPWKIGYSHPHKADAAHTVYFENTLFIT